MYTSVRLSHGVPPVIPVIPVVVCVPQFENRGHTHDNKYRALPKHTTQTVASHSRTIDQLNYHCQYKGTTKEKKLALIKPSRELMDCQENDES